MRAFEDRFVTLGLNYRVIGGPRFYERAEIRDALAYFRATVSPADDLAFERIVNTPRRGIGETSIKALHDRARQMKAPLMAAAAEIVETDEIAARTRASLRDLLASFARWRLKLDAIPHTELAELILEESGYTEMWQADRSADAPGRLENLKELIRSMEDFDTMVGFLEHVSLVMDADAEGGNDAVNIMTLHSAKGLEFDTVFLPGWEEGLFPSQRTLDENGRAGLEEERRLAYVGITRARHRAHIRFAANRRMHGLWQTGIPSRFLDELPEAHVEVIEEATNYGGYGSAAYGGSRFDTRDPFANTTYGTPGWQRAQRNKGMAEDAAAATRRRRQEAARLRPSAQLRAAADRGRAGGEERHRRDQRLFGRRARLPPEVRLRADRRHRRQQAHHRLREGGREARAGFIRGAALGAATLVPVTRGHGATLMALSGNPLAWCEQGLPPLPRPDHERQARPRS